ncbi:glycosyltransferase family 2 protein [Halalkalibacter okhensis]|uniref:Glucosyl-3-phosphoglycerate synthase n=1 Tax=Halalkalibacter okhensis TaxID=333138 RepID=A0A0B0IF72_9BACI|nr:glycosyltransferase family 2 protein [Halalkalibacter okhensis]KHF39527.1 dolichyl-phosphate mannose synthase [Halalkalibacter okhensis]
MIDTSFVIAAYNEEETIEKTLLALKMNERYKRSEIIVVNDGSKDQTKVVAEKHADQVISYSINKGKGHAMLLGWQRAKGEYIVCLDADLEESASEAFALIEPIRQTRADMTISIINPGKKSGMGVVKRRVQAIVYEKTGVKLEAPLSGQRAFHRKWLSVLLTKSYNGFGIETQMTIDLLKAGASCLEIPTTMKHREMGRDIKGFYHRLKQWIDIEKQLRGVQS